MPFSQCCSNIVVTGESWVTSPGRTVGGTAATTSRSSSSCSGRVVGEGPLLSVEGLRMVWTGTQTFWAEEALGSVEIDVMEVASVDCDEEGAVRLCVRASTGRKRIVAEILILKVLS